MSHTNEPVLTAQKYLDNPIPFDIPDIEPFLETIKKLISFDEATGASVAESLQAHPDRRNIWESIPVDIQLELGYDPRFKGRVKQQILPPDEHPIAVYCAGRGFGKTFTIAQYANWYATRVPGCKISVCGQTASDIRNVIMRGKSGVLQQSHPS